MEPFLRTHHVGPSTDPWGPAVPLVCAGCGARIAGIPARMRDVVGESWCRDCAHRACKVP